MDKNTLNGFEVFEEFMPGGVANKNTFNTSLEDDFDGAGEELTDEEIEEIRKNNNPDKEEPKEGAKTKLDKWLDKKKEFKEIVKEVKKSAFAAKKEDKKESTSTTEEPKKNKWRR